MDSGFLAMIAQPGMGKTTLLFHLLHRLQATARTAFIFQTQCTAHELLRHLLSEFECDTSITDPVRMFQELKTLLLAEANAGRRCVVLIDEAQNLSPEVLETIRLLSNFETPRRKLMNIVLSGQAELGEVLNRAGMRQLRQRLSCIVYLKTFTPAETAHYIAHRLEVAGFPGKISDIFSTQSLIRIAQLSEGVPRVINNLCFNAMSLGYALDTKRIDLEIIEEVASDLGISGTPRLDAFASSESVNAHPAKPSYQAPEDCEEAEKDVLAAVSSMYTEREYVKIAAFPAELTRDDASATPIEGKAPEHIQTKRSGVEDSVANLQEALFSGIKKATSMDAERATEAVERSAEQIERFPPKSAAGVVGQSSAKPFLVRGLICILALCIAPLADFPAHQNVSARSVEETSPTLSKSSAKQTLAPDGDAHGLQATASPLNSSLPPARIAVVPHSAAKPLALERLLRSLHRATQVDLALASFSPEPLLEPLPLHPMTAPVNVMASPDSRKYAASAPIAHSTPHYSETAAAYIAPKAIWQPAPTYVSSRYHRHPPKDVQLVLFVSSNGDVYRVGVLKGRGRLASAAERAAETWKYSPAVSNGVPVNSQVYVTIQFRQH